MSFFNLIYNCAGPPVLFEIHNVCVAVKQYFSHPWSQQQAFFPIY